MDAVRIGRALGLGARLAAKTVANAVDAATAESPSARAGGERANTTRQSAAAKPQIQSPMQTQSSPRLSAPIQLEGQGTASRGSSPIRTTRQVPAQRSGLWEGLRRFWEGVWKPFVRLAGVLWLEVTGVFFGVFAAFAVSAMWKLRAAWHATAANTKDHENFLWSGGMALVFGYFCVSGFVRARRRERGR